MDSLANGARDKREISCDDVNGCSAVEVTERSNARQVARDELVAEALAKRVVLRTLQQDMIN